jgi:hypothetical protein
MDPTLVIDRNNKQFNKLLYLAPLAFLVATKSAYNNFATGDNFRVGIAFIIILFCILMIVFFLNAIKQSNNKEFALKINEKGIIDNISMAKPGLINWENIEKFEILKSSGHQHLFVFVKQPEKYIQNVKGFKKGMVNQLFKDKGSPIAIDLRRIKYDANELLTILEKEKTYNK